MRLFDFLRRSLSNTKEPVILQGNTLAEQNKINCHYCGELFEVITTFPVQVKLLYRDEYITGKGAKCPECNKICIVG